MTSGTKPQEYYCDQYGRHPIFLDASAFIKTLMDDADASAAQTTLGISTFIKTLLDDADAPAALATLGKGYVVLSAGSPYSLAAHFYETFLVTATTNPYIINLPQATACVGYRARIVAANPATTGLVKIVPYSGDAIGSIGADVAVYLQNVDQSGFAYRFQFIDLIATVSGYWAVIAGQFCPDQSVDTDGQQYHLGKLHHLPLGNATARDLYNTTSPAAANYSSAITGAGIVGIPAGAKAIRVRVEQYTTSSAAGSTMVRVAFTDNNSNTPGYLTGHPFVGLQYTAAAASSLGRITNEIDIPLNSSGQFYLYTITLINCAANTTVCAIGFYMGD
jgi:hypothetical protein